MELIPGTVQVSEKSNDLKSNFLSSEIYLNCMVLDVTLISGLADDATYMAKTDEVVTLNISTEAGKPISYRVRQEKHSNNSISST